MRSQLHSPNCTSLTSNCTKYIKEFIDTLLVLTLEDTKKGMDRVVNFSNHLSRITSHRICINVIVEQLR